MPRKRSTTVANVVRMLETLEPLDSEFADELAAIRTQQPPMNPDPWPDDSVDGADEAEGGEETVTDDDP